MLKRVNPRLLRSERLRRCKLGECRAACCLNGVWIDRNEAEDLRKNARLILPYLSPEWQDPGCWFEEDCEPDEHALSGAVIRSRVVEAPAHYGGRACVFLRPDFKCALQVAGEAAGFHPWRFKPFYCILHPLDLDEQGRITLDSVRELIHEAGSCLRPAREATPLVVTFEEELRYLLGDRQYAALLETARRQKS